MANHYVGVPCAHCGVALTLQETVAVCGSCGRPHHIQCWQAHRSCATPGCGGQIGQVLEPEPLKPLSGYLPQTETIAPPVMPAQQPAQAYNQQPPAYNPQPQAYNPQPQAYNRQPRAYNQQPQAYNQQTQAYNPQPTAYNRQPPAHYGQQVPQQSAQAEKPARAEAPKKKYTGLIITGVALLLAAVGIIVGIFIYTNSDGYLYGEAQAALDSKNYSQAREEFSQLEGYEDSADKVLSTWYLEGCDLMDAGEYAQAADRFKKAGSYLDAGDRYNNALCLHIDGLLEGGDYVAAHNTTQQLTDNSLAQQQRSRVAQSWTETLLDDTASLVAPDAVGDYLDLVEDERAITDSIYDTLMHHITTHTEMNDWPDDSPVAEKLSTVFDRLSGYDHAGRLSQFFAHIHDGFSHRQNFIRYNRSVYEELWHLALVRNYVSSEGVIELFLIGKWTGGGYYLTFIERESGKPGNDYSLPRVVPPKGSVDYTIRDGEFLWLDANNQETARIFRITLLDPDAIEVYCYKNDKTYIMNKVS